MRKWRTLARVIDYDFHSGGEIGVYVVFPGWNWRLAVFVDKAPPGIDLDALRRGEAWRCYAMACIGCEDYRDLDVEWCD